MEWKSSRIATGVALTLTGLALFGFAAACVEARHGVGADPGWTWLREGNNYLVAKVDPDGLAKQLRTGDRITAIGDRRNAVVFGPALALAEIPPGSVYSASVERDGVRQTYMLTMGTRQSLRLHDQLPEAIVAMMLFVAGILIVIAGTRDITGALGAATLLVLVFPTIATILIAHPGWNPHSTEAALLLAVVWRPWHVTLGYDFLSRFPQPVAENRATRAVRQLFYGVCIVLWATMSGPLIAQIAGLRLPFAWTTPAWLSPGAGPGPSAPVAAFEAAASIAWALVLVRNYRRQPNENARRKIRWVAAGNVLTAATYLCFKLLQALFIMTGSAPFRVAADVAGTCVTISLGIAVMTLVYAMIRHQVLGIRAVIRRGLQYLLAKQMLRLFVILPLIIVFIQILRNPERSTADVVFRSSWIFYLLVAGSALLSLRYGRKLMAWLDRRFFRATIESEQVLSTLIERLRGANSEGEVATTVAKEIDTAMHLEGVHVLLRPGAGEPLNVAFSYAPEEAVFACDYLNQTTSPFHKVQVTELHDVKRMNGSFGSSGTEPKDLLILPLVGTGGTDVGALVLGPKRSEQPFTSRDHELLEAVAGQAAVMYDVLRLKQRVEKDGKERVEILGRLDKRISLLRECPKCGQCYGSDDEKCSRDGSTLTLTLPVERTVERRYRLDRRLGRGGMGVVYEATDIRLNRTVALKIMVGELFGNQQALARFGREARAAAALNHANIVSVYDFGPLSAGGAFQVMELVNGTSWRNHLRDSVPIAVDRVAAWVEQLCEGVAFAHASGIVHRDLKPENVMIAPAGTAERAIILDFGLAKIKKELDQAEVDLTIAGAVVGTRAYMSPEQSAGEEVDSRTDVYAIGVMALETLARLRPPSAGATRKWVNEAIPRFAQPDSKLGQILRGALEEAVERRTARIEDLAQALPHAIRAEATLWTAPGDKNSADTQTL